MRVLEFLASIASGALTIGVLFCLNGKDIELYHIFYVMVFFIAVFLTQMWFIADREGEK